MKLLLITFSIMISSLLFAKCDEFKVSKVVKENLEQLVNSDLGNGARITKVENIEVLTTTDNKNNVIALYSFQETLLGKTGRESLFKMLGYAKFDSKKCKNFEGTSLGSSPLKEN